MSESRDCADNRLLLMIFSTSKPDQYVDNISEANAQSANASAHLANSSSTILEHSTSTLNGVDTLPSAPNDTQPSSNLTTQVTDPEVTESTQPASLPIKDSDLDASSHQTDTVITNLPLPDSAPVIQPPTSDARHTDLPQEPVRLSLDVKEPEVRDPIAVSADAEGSKNANAVLPSDPVVGSPGVTLDQNPEEKSDDNQKMSNGVGQPPLSPVGNVVEALETSESAMLAPSGDASSAPTVERASVPLPDASTNGHYTAPEESSQDQVMADIEPPTKISRAREGDDADGEPAAKRTRTDDDGAQNDFKRPDRPQVDTAVDAQHSSTTTEPSPMTKLRKKHLAKAIGNIKRNQAAKPFLVPVDAEALNIPTYYTIITNPMDLKTIEDKLRADGYATVDALRADFDQLVQNTRKFNGDVHPVTQNAFTTRDKFEQAMSSMPSADAVDSAAPKKKIPDPMSVRAPPPPRRESRSSLPGSARSPATAASPQTFALGPEGLPLIRRDSTIDGRPKREIIPPAPKDLPYSNQKPKKKKYILELKFCDHVLKELAKAKYKEIYDPFKVPVDPVALNIPSYHSIIKKPMDFGTMRTRLDRGAYENAKEFEADARLVFRNCYSFNPENDPVNKLGKALEAVFNNLWSEKRRWLDDNTPASGQRSPASTEDEESEEEEEEEEEEDTSQLDVVAKLQKQIAEMSKQVEMITSGAKKKTPPTASKKATKAAKPGKKESKKAAPASSKAEKKPTAKVSKKASAPYVTYEQKQDISTRINSLPEAKMSQALSIIRSNMPNLKGVQEDELELDIDELDNNVLYKLLQFVRRHAPRPDDSPLQAASNSTAAAPSRKKNKPMSKIEQEARIAQVQSNLSTFQRGSSCELPMVRQWVCG